jgi:hypothetical protein
MDIHTSLQTPRPYPSTQLHYLLLLEQDLTYIKSATSLRHQLLVLYAANPSILIAVQIFSVPEALVVVGLVLGISFSTSSYTSVRRYLRTRVSSASNCSTLETNPAAIRPKRLVPACRQGSLEGPVSIISQICSEEMRNEYGAISRGK